MDCGWEIAGGEMGWTNRRCQANFPSNTQLTAGLYFGQASKWHISPLLKHTQIHGWGSNYAN